MKAERKGRTELWAKALGAVLLASVVALVAAFAVSGRSEADREHDAFEATQRDARRFAVDLLTGKGRTPTDQDIRDALDEAPGFGVLVETRSTPEGTRLLVQFSRSYERTLVLFGPADTMATRCFTIDLPSTSPSGPRIKAHGPKEPCGTVAGSTSN
ncbi:hypothetical protein ABZ621_25325 [Streptomyces sp. NPDC007863]|uniref:hypothetical protein n=1 Tax=Streptomyces sp. NPDC007863 TaxID=3154894 RepID=UPI0033FB70CC